jgi:hypothetical protein
MNKTTDNRAVSRPRDSVEIVSRAWAPFSKKLAIVLSQLEQKQYLIISAKSCNRYIQFACQGGEGMRVEVTSNHFLKGKNRLNRRQISWLRANGWNAPTGKLNEATPEKDPSNLPTLPQISVAISSYPLCTLPIPPFPPIVTHTSQIMPYFEVGWAQKWAQWNGVTPSAETNCNWDTQNPPPQSHGDRRVSASASRCDVARSEGK